ncbi:hypothetical protein C8R43DRAFT_1210808 [Mycena crocata]|nr:hypothetical protein C8R43DRAFT_1210808 [Mycena crocata]
MAFINHIQRQRDAECILATPGVRAVVGRAWAIFLEIDHGDGLYLISHFLYPGSKMHASAEMQEFVDGAGGTLPDLALTVVRASSLDAHICRNFLQGTASLAGPRGPYETALLEHGIVGAVTTAICALNQVPMTDIMSAGGKLLEMYLGLLRTLIPDRQSYIYIAESLKAGLLLAIVSVTIDADNVHRHMLLFLKSWLVPGLMEEEEEEDCLRGPKLKQQVAALHTCDVYMYATDAQTSPPV